MTSTALEHRTSGTAIQVGAGQMTPVEWQAIEQQAHALAASSIVPRAFKGTPADIVAVACLGREVGLSPMASMQSIHVIEGKPSMSAQLMGALVRARGHSLEIVKLDDDGCTMRGVRADTGNAMEFTFTRQDAQAAGLAGKQVWKAYFKAMAAARCTSQIARVLFADVLAGISYTPEEAASIAGVDVVVDSEGEVTAIEGEVVKPAAPKPARVEAPTMTPALQPVTKPQLDALAARIKALPKSDAAEINTWRLAAEIAWNLEMTTIQFEALEKKVAEYEGEEVAAEDVTTFDPDDLGDVLDAVDAAQAPKPKPARKSTAA